MNRQHLKEQWLVDDNRLEMTSGGARIIIEKLTTEKLGFKVAESLKADLFQIRTLYTPSDGHLQVGDDPPHIVMTPNPPKQMPHPDEVFIVRNMRHFKILWLLDRDRLEISCGEYVLVIEPVDPGKRMVAICPHTHVPPRETPGATRRWKCPENEAQLSPPKGELTRENQAVFLSGHE